MKNNFIQEFFKKLLLPTVICAALVCPVFAPAALHAQTAAELETLLQAGAVSYGQAARFVLQAAEISGAEDAFRYAMERKWLPARAAQDDSAKLDGVSLLIMRAFDMKGGSFFYTMIKNPHYAYRELLYQNIIQGRTDPGMAVSGDLLLFVVSRVLERKEEDK